MTKYEFNIKWLAYIEDGYYGLEFDIPEVTKFLDNIMLDLTKIPGFKIHQIKMKFNNSRFYTNLGSYMLSNLIERKINEIANK